MVRTCCGNRITEFPATAVSLSEPMPALLAGPVISFHTDVVLEFLDAPLGEDSAPGPFPTAFNPTPGPSTSGPGEFELPPLFWYCITPSNHSTPGNPLPKPVFPFPILGPVPTPETNSLTLLAVGVMAITMWLCFRSR